MYLALPDKIGPMAPRSCLLIFTKPAVAGRVKTRLVGDLSPEQAARLHQAFLDDLLERISGGPFDLRVTWALEEDEALPPDPVGALRQEGADLGERLYRGLARSGREYELVGAVGSDHPEMALETVTTAFRWLEEGADVVLGPAEDGGYYFVGVRREALHPRMFEEIPWSTSAVLSRTRQRIEELGLEARYLDPGHDVDTPEDLGRLAARIDRGEIADLHATEKLLRSWNRLDVGAVGERA